MSVPTPNQVLAAADRALRERYPGALVAFAAGSILRGEGRPHSDLDLVVLHERLDHAWRESFLIDGLPVEAFVHDPETLAWFFRKDRQSGRPALVGMVAEGRILGARSDLGVQWRERAGALLQAGPPPLEAAEAARMRYGITDKLDDLRGHRSAEEILAIGAALYAALAEFILRSRGRWAGAGKWLWRRLAMEDPELARRFSGAFEALYRGDPSPVIALAEEALAPFGGLLFEGDREAAAPDARLKDASD